MVSWWPMLSCLAITIRSGWKLDELRVHELSELFAEKGSKSVHPSFLHPDQKKTSRAFDRKSDILDRYE